MAIFCKIVLPSNEIHVLGAIPKTFDELSRLILQKFHDRLPENFCLKYRDADDELVLLSNEEDLQTAVLTANAENLKNLRIIVVESTTHQNTTKYFSLNSATYQPEKQANSRNSLDKHDVNHIPMTESIVGFSSHYEKPSRQSTFGSQKTVFGEVNPGRWDEIAVAGHNDSASAFISPIIGADMQKNGQKHFFTRADSIPYELNKSEHEKEEGFSSEQLRIISQVVEQSVRKSMEDKLELIISEVLTMVQSTTQKNDINLRKNGMVLPRSSVSNLMSSIGAKFSLKKTKEQASEDSFCSECKVKIKGIRYSCLACRNYSCCETCENNVEHPHPLLKIKPAKPTESSSPEPDLSAHLNSKLTQSNINNYSFAGTPVFNQEQSFSMTQSVKLPGRRSFVPSNTYSEHNQTKDTSITQSESTTPTLPIKRTLEHSDTKDLRRYKVTVVKEPLYDVIRVKPSQGYNVAFTIKNSGTDKWAPKTTLLCIHGLHKGDERDIPSLVVNQEHVVELRLNAPANCGRYLSQWKIHYYEDDLPKPVGKAIFVEIDVTQAAKESPSLPKVELEKTKLGALYSDDEDDRGTRAKDRERRKKEEDDLAKDHELMKETQCSNDVLKRAKILNDMFPGEVKEKIEFINENETNLDINDLVTAYLDKLSASLVKKGSTSGIQRTTSSWL